MEELIVKTKTNALRMNFYVSDNSNHTIGIQNESVLSLSMINQECVVLQPGDYVDYLGHRFWVIEAYTPKQNSTVEWNYDVKLYGVESITQQALMLNSEGTPLEAYHAPAVGHLQMVVMNLNRWMGNITDWKIGNVITTDILDIDYSGGTYCDAALDKIADAAGVEWWIQGMTINISRCEYGEPITLGYGNGLLTIERDNADNVPFFTRLFPLGSTRNIDFGRYGKNRLQLPSGKNYVERNTDKYGVVEYYEENAFSHIYPRRTGYVSTLRVETAKNDDGTEYGIYYFSDQSLNFNPNNYEIGGLVKRIIFQEGNLAGRDFEVNWNNTTQEFEIITTWPYNNDIQVPGGSLIPTPGNSYILYNIRMPDEYYPIAEQEFQTSVNEFLDQHSGLTDRSVFKCKTNYIDLDNRSVNLFIGQRVRLVSDRFFPTKGYLDSRITHISRNIHRPNDADIEISYVLSQTAQSAIKSSINQVSHEVKTASSTFPDILRSWDNTLPTDNNIFSSRRVLRESLSKKNNDTASGLITFKQGILVGDYNEGEAGGKIDSYGNGELLSLVLRSLLRSKSFVDGLSGSGFGLSVSDDLASLTIDRLTVRQSMVVLELLIQKVRSAGGQIIVSPANGKIKSVVENNGNYIITFETDNTFVANDLIRCSTFTGGTLKSYWVEVASISGNSIIVPTIEFEGQVPAEGDECVLMGNTNNASRQNLISISAAEDGHPRIDILDGVQDKNLNGCLRARLGNLDGISDLAFSANNQPKGYGLYADNAFLKGTFLLVTGEDIKTKFEITEGLIRSQVNSVREDFIEEKGYLNNPTFGNGMNRWDTTNEAVFFLANNKWIWLNNQIYSNKGDYAAVRNDEGRTTVFIKNNYIVQSNSNLRSKPTFEVNGEGIKEPCPVYLSFFYKCVTSGTLTAEFVNVDKTGFVNFNSLQINKSLEISDGYIQFAGDGLWNGTGDFKLTFTGEIYLYMLVLSTDKVESLKYQYQTLFEQSDKLVRIAASNFDTEGKVLQSSQIITKADMNMIASGLFDIENGAIVEGAGLITRSDMAQLFVIGPEGDLVSMVETSTEGVKIKANNISLEGLVTANEHFKILIDGSIETVNAKVSGEINATSGKIGGFKITGYSIINDYANADFNMRQAAIIFRDDSKGVFAGIGTNVFPGSSGVSVPCRFENCDTTNQYGMNVAIYVKASGGLENAAILIDSGNISGFAIAVKQLSTSQSITNKDCFISCYNNSTITIKLPVPTTPGKIFYFRIINEADIILDAYTEGGKQILKVDSTTANSVTCTVKGELVSLIWDGQYWLYNSSIQ